MSSNALVVGLCALSLGATCFLIASSPGGADERVAELERKLVAAETRADAVESLRVELREMQAKLDRRLSEAVRRADAAASPGSPAGFASPGPVPADPLGETGASAKPLDELVADRVEQRMTEKLDALAAAIANAGGDGKWKAPLDALAKELTLTDEQKLEAKRVFDRSRDEAFTLLKTQRLDGGSLLDDYVGALKGGADPTETTKRLFQRIFTEKVPGTDDTFLVEFIAMQQGVEEELSRRLDESQMKRLKQLNVDLLDVKSGYDPVGDYVRARLQ